MSDLRVNFTEGNTSKCVLVEAVLDELDELVENFTLVMKAAQHPIVINTTSSQTVIEVCDRGE